MVSSHNSRKTTLKRPRKIIAALERTVDELNQPKVKGGGVKLKGSGQVLKRDGIRFQQKWADTEGVSVDELGRLLFFLILECSLHRNHQVQQIEGSHYFQRSARFL